MNLSNAKRDDMREWIRTRGYENVVPDDFWKTVHKIIYIGIRENPAKQQKHVIISVEKRQMTTFNTESYYFIKERRKTMQEAWDGERLVGSYQ